MAGGTELRDFTKRVPGSYFEVVYPHNGVEHVIEPLHSTEEASMVCDVLTLKEAIDGTQGVQLHSQALLPLGPPLGTLRHKQLISLSFSEVVRQLQDCVAQRIHHSLAPGSAGGRLLCLAAQQGHASFALLILLVDPEAAQYSTRELQTPLHFAAGTGQEAVVRILLAAASSAASIADIGDKCLPLHLASRNGHTAICQLLLDRAPETATVKGDRGLTPLHLAAQNGHTAACQLLLETAPAPATSADINGRLPLHLAAMNGHTATCQLLVDRAPEAASVVESQESQGWPHAGGRTPLHWAAQSGHTAACQLLLETAPATATSADSNGRLPLHLAAKNGHTATCQLLLDRAPETAASYGDGRLPLHLAAMKGHTATCRLLLDRAPEAASVVSYDWTDSDSAGMTPLHLAAQSGHTDTCQLLLETAPATATSAASNGWLPLHLAAMNGHTAACRLLLDRAPEAASVVESQESQGWPHAGGRTPLHWAARRGHIAACQLLLETALATATTTNSNGQLPLHLAADIGHTATCQLLLDRAPEAATVADSGGFLPLHAALAPEYGPPHLDTARCLLAFGPATAVLAALHSTPRALPLFADFVIACPLLTSDEWAAVPTPCPGLGRTLPAVLARSTDQARQLVQHLPPADAQRLRVAALSLHRAQSAPDLALPAAVVWSILALCLAD